MFILKTDASFDSAHFLAGYAGKCSNIHGHRWEVCVEAAGDKLQEEGQCRGMVVDFSALKKDLSELADEFDHSLIIEEGSLRESTLMALKEEKFRVVQVPFRPTAENFSKYFYDAMTAKGYRVVRTTVYETPKNCATYEA